jgi:hypothetical protein
MDFSSGLSKLSRRGFLSGTATTIAAVALSGAELLADRKSAPADQSAGLTAEQSRTLLRCTRDLFPHDRLGDSFYEKAIAPLQEEASNDPSIDRLLADGIAQLDRLAREASGKSFADTREEKTRVGVIQEIEGSPFFAKVYGTTLYSL